MSYLSELKPTEVWSYFEEICLIPRLSKNEEKIREYLMAFAKRNNLESKQDTAGNILITKPASPGYDNLKTITLQSHMDMVGEKNADHPHNWSEDPIIPVIKGEWVTASGTTLGADDGIGIAAQLALLSDRNLKSGKIECLFTVDEESGMTGAINLNKDSFEGRILINLDSEDEGIIYIGCAGGIDTVGTLGYKPLPAPADSSALLISVTGLHGGHSGDEIHKGYGNSVKIMNRILMGFPKQSEFYISKFDGGNLRNAIPREAFATVVVKNELEEDVIKWVWDFTSVISEELGKMEPEMKISVTRCPMPSTVLDSITQNNILSAIDCCPHGALAWSAEMDDLVETSTNLASIKFEDGSKIRIVTTQRSSIERSKLEAALAVSTCLLTAGFEVTHSEGYPGWKPNLSSEILRITCESYKNLFAKEPLIRAIHAGLECGLIYEKVKGIDMISIGPTIRGAHTPEEKIEIITAQMFWDLLLDVIKNTPARD